jgi:hypothetical protein
VDTLSRKVHIRSTLCVWFSNNLTSLVAFFFGSVPAELKPFLPMPIPGATANLDLPKFFLLPSSKETDFLCSMRKSHDEIRKEKDWLFCDSRFVNIFVLVELKL